MYLNMGNFEGTSGCHADVIMRLELASDMLNVALKAKNPIGLFQNSASL